MKMKTITKRILILFLAVMAMMVNANAKKVPYATLSGRTLTLEYGELPTGQYVYDMSNEKFYENWSPIVASIEKITIEPSFAEVRFKTCARLFCEMSSLKSIEGLRYLNTSEVTDMKMMFLGCAKLTDLDVSGFNTSQVTDMSAMFSGCSRLASLDLGSFNTSNVTNMSYMFYKCSSLTSLKISSFNTSKVTGMSYMFGDCSSLTSLDVSSFNTSSVTGVSGMMGMFYGCSKLTSLNLSNFNTSNVTNMTHMFYGCSSLTSLDISSFNTSNVTNMTCMFSNCRSLTSLDVSGFNTSNVTNMRYMFYDVRMITSLDVSSFNTSNVTNMSYMFWGCSKLTSLDLSSFNTSSVNDMNFMFAYCTRLATVELRSFNTSNVTNMSCMFFDCYELTSLDLVNFNTSNVTDMIQMFYDCHRLTTIYCNDKWSCNNSSGMFANCNMLEGAISYSSSNIIDVTNANPETGYFTYKDYDLWVNGIQVTHTNYNDLSGISGVSGTVKYDTYADALILDNATITATGNQESAIRSEMSNLRIHVEGSSTLTSATGSGIRSTGSLEFSGGNESSLSVNGTTAVLMMSDAENRLKVKDLNLTLDGTKYYGVLSFYSNTVMEIQSNSEVKTRGVLECYRNLNDIIIPDSCEITEPAGAYISGGKVYAADGNTVKNEWVTIGPKGYDLWVGGVQVNVTNCSNITGSNIKQGTASYDDETKTLTLTDCSIGMDYTTGTIGIKSSMDSLAIHLVGNNSIGMVDTGIESTGDVTIAGPGKLGFVICNTGIYMTEISLNDLLVTDGAKLDMALVGTGVLGKKWNIKIAGQTITTYPKTLRVSGGMTDVNIVASTSAISDMNKLVLNDGLSLTAPVGAKFASHAVCDKDGNVVKGKNVRFSLAGDVNNDGAVTMADANAVVNYFLATDKPSNFDVDNANVNGDADDDGKPSITMADANAIVNMFLGQ